MTIQLKINVLPEPLIEFSNAKTDIDPRRGLPRNGPADNRGVRRIRLGFVGLPDDVKASVKWFSSLDQFMPAKEANSARYRNWPGIKKALNAEFVLEERHQRHINASRYELLFKDAQRGQKFGELVDLFEDEISGLYGDEAPDCIIVCIKPELGDLRVTNPGLTHGER